MSFLTVEWVINDAPLQSLTEFAVLVGMAQRAREDGTGAYRGKPALARIARCDAKTVQRVQRSLEKRGIIALGDQRLVAHFDAGRRPVVYDILIPFTWFGDKIERINRERAEAGMPPLTPENRPPLAAAPERPTRSDKGKPNPKRRPKSLGPTSGEAAPGGDADEAAGDSDEQPGQREGKERGDSESPLAVAAAGESVPAGGTDSPPSGDCESTPGETENPPSGDCESTPGGTVSPERGDSESPNYVCELPDELPTTKSGRTSVTAVGGPTVGTARAAEAPAAQPGRSREIQARAVLARLRRYREAPGWVRVRYLVPMTLQALDRGFEAIAIGRYAELVAGEARFAEHQHVPEFREVLRRLGRDVALGTTCPRFGVPPGDCPCGPAAADAPTGDRPWTEADQADLERILEQFEVDADELGDEQQGA